MGTLLNKTSKWASTLTFIVIIILIVICERVVTEDHGRLLEEVVTYLHEAPPLHELPELQEHLRLEFPVELLLRERELRAELVFLHDCVHRWHVILEVLLSKRVLLPMIARRQRVGHLSASWPIVESTMRADGKSVDSYVPEFAP